MKTTRKQAEVEIAPKNVLNIHEVCALTGLSKSRIHVLCSRGDIPYYKRGRSYFKRNEIEDWLTANRQPSRQEREAAAAKYSHTR